MKIVALSDTHSRHHEMTYSVPNGDILIHAGDFMSSGYNPSEAESFFSWYDSIEGYETKILISGNHDRIMENDPSWASGVLTGYKTIKMVDYKSTEQLITYFKGLDENIEKNRKSVKESFIQNQIDTVQELIYSTLYKLRFLK